MGMVDKILARFTTETLKKVLPLAVDDYHARKMLLDQERLEEEGGDWNDLLNLFQGGDQILSS